ncbi:hypothetical protein JD844_007869 [Phrynosoma platyrhinos]|uniref:Deoxyribodipyrimidine photo-lyase n=1 Tax=Phrynosoma platyrhinos TaxID=52577 RepID=A0ABQ7T3M1_PHRPL|nr:hypothetical protein JD844_007869 [Phrynosoma platyrhinos]
MSQKRKKWKLPGSAESENEAAEDGATSNGSENGGKVAQVVPNMPCEEGEKKKKMKIDTGAADNWAFLYAQRLALKQKLPLHVCFCLVPKFLDATIRHFGFMLRGLKDVAEVLVDVDKQEYGARTIRKKIHDRLAEFLTEFPPVIKHPHPAAFQAKPIDWDACYASLQVDRSVKEVAWAKPGTAAGLMVLEEFIKERLKFFGTDRNNPNRAALSNLSPWFHFGQISVQRAILEVRKHRSRYKESVEGFIEEAVVRRELADNFCYYNQNYDKVEGCMWSICGIHDQGWAERAVFGKIRYMNYAGCKRKFDVGQFERKYSPRKFAQ